MIWEIFLIVSVSYFLGSIPFAYLAVKFFKKTDIRKLGSGNVGATNVLRVLGPIPGVAVLFLDGLKGYLAVVLAGKIGLDFNQVFYHWFLVFAGLLAILGHIYPVWLGFKGGKGVATGTGVLLALSGDIFIIAVLVAILVIAITRYVSLGSLIGVCLVFILALIWKKPLPFQIVAFLGAVFIIIRHKDNIKRILSGTEKKIGQG